MKRLLPLLLALLTLPMGAMQAHAVTWLCTTAKAPRVAETGNHWQLAGAEREGNASRSVARSDIIQAYSGQPVLLGGTWLLAYMLPADSADTKAAFLELGISPVAAQAMTRNSLVDRGIRIAKTPEELLDKLVKNPPAVGYTSFFLGANKNVAACF
jgi:hypothetical protein